MGFYGEFVVPEFGFGKAGERVRSRYRVPRGRSPPRLETRMMEPSLIVVAYGPVHIVVHERDPDIEGIGKAATVQRRPHGESGRSLCLLTVVQAGLSMPASHVRERSAKLMRANADWTECAAIVAQRAGSWIPAAEPFAAGLNVRSRASIPLRLFTDQLEPAT